MKLKLILLSAVAVLAASQIAVARTNTPAPDSTQPAPAASASDGASASATPAATTPAPTTDATAPAAPATATPSTDSSAPAATTTPAPATADAPPITPTAAAPSTDASTPAPAPSTDAAAPATTPAAPAAQAATTDSPDTPAVEPAKDASTPAAQPVAATDTPATPAPAAAADTNAPAAPATPAPTAAADTNAPAAPAATTAQADTAAPAPAATPAPAADSAASAAPAHDPNAIIPLIVMDEVPLTDAIKNLARQAGLNYMLDPKINYGQVAPDGHVSNPQPMVTLRWENLTADQALNAVLNNYNLIIVDDPKTKIARITIKDPAAPDPLTTKIIQLKYAYATNLLINAQAVLIDKRSKVMADARTSQLVVVATDKEMANIDQLVARLDTPTKQVLIEAKLVETTKNPTTSKGVDWTSTLQAQHLAYGNGAAYIQTPTLAGQTTVTSTGGGVTTTATSTPAGPVAANTTAASPGVTGIVGSILQPGTIPMLQYNTHDGFNPEPFFLNADGLSAVLSFLNTEADAQVLSTPRAVTLDNEEAILSVTVAQPIFNTTAGTQGSPGGAQVLYTNLGTILKVTPRISANNTISLKVVPEVSDIGGTITKTVGGLAFQADFYDIRKVTTQVLIPSGNTLVMGGLVSDNRAKGITKVPFLGDIPVLGWGFRSETKTQNKRNLIIFVTPTIVTDEDFQPTETSFLKTKMKDSKNIADFGPWDKGEPQDWSKLVKGNKPVPDSNNNDN